MSRGFEPLTRYVAFADLKDIASLRGVTVKGARWAHEAKEWGAAILLFGPNGQQIGMANTIPVAVDLVRQVKVCHD